MKRMMTAVFFLLLASVQAGEPAETAARLLARIPAGTMVLQQGDWLYSRNELEHLSKGPLTEQRIVTVSACKRKKNADPAAALQYFHQQLRDLNIALIIIPVPPKCAIQPLSGMKKGEAMNYLKPYYRELEKKGLEILDSSVIFLKNPSVQTYCQTDAHWSPAGIRLTVDALADKITLRGNSGFEIQKHSIRTSGDLAKSLSAANPLQEELQLETVSGKVFSEESPILVIGDSHTLIFSAGGDMLSEKSGFCELLAAKLKMPVDRLGVRGSASSSVRIDLYRRAVRQPDWLKRKKYVIYLFSCREFTETISGWSRVPVMKKP